MQPPSANPHRLYLIRTLKVLGLAGAAVALFPFLGALTTGGGGEAPADPGVSLADLAPGAVRELQWRGRPVLVYRHQAGDLVPPREGLHPDYVVLSAVEGLRGCRVRHVPAGAADAPAPGWRGGFVEPCFGARYDLSGRKAADSGRPGQGDLTIPPHRIAAGSTLLPE